MARVCGFFECFQSDLQTGTYFTGHHYLSALHSVHNATIHRYVIWVLYFYPDKKSEWEGKQWHASTKGKIWGVETLILMVALHLFVCFSRVLLHTLRYPTLIILFYSYSMITELVFIFGNTHRVVHSSMPTSLVEVCHLLWSTQTPLWQQQKHLLGWALVLSLELCLRLYW